jgi:hypothetical protein
MHVDADQYRPAVLENLVMRADADSGEVLAQVVGAGLLHGLLQDGMHRAHGDRSVDHVGKELRHAAERTVTGQGQAEDRLP